METLTGDKTNVKNAREGSENEHNSRDRMLTAAFKDYDNALKAFNILYTRGYNKTDILLAISDKTMNMLKFKQTHSGIVQSDSSSYTIANWNLPMEYSKLYESEIENGMVVIGIYPKNYADTEFIEKSWRFYKGDVQYC